MATKFLQIFATASFLITNTLALKPLPGEFVLLGEECTDNSTCSSGNIPNSFCKFNNKILSGYPGGSCECTEGYISSHDLQRCLPSNVHIGRPCHETVQCMGHYEGKSVCLPGSGICECKNGYIHNRDMTECLVKINTLGTRECQEDVQCWFGKPGRLSYCAVNNQGPFFQPGEKVCKCKPEAVDGVGSNANKCHKKAKNFGDGCKLQAQCTAALENSICISGKCEKHPAFDVWRSRVTGGGGRPRVE